MSQAKRKRKVPLWIAVPATLAVALMTGGATLLCLLFVGFIASDGDLSDPDFNPPADAVAAITGAGALVPAVLLYRAMRRPHSLPAPSHCPYCDYNLTGNVSGICPECGRPVHREPEAEDEASR